MKIERIKKNHKKEIIIGGLILVSIVSAITLVTTRAKYWVTQNIKLAKGTVNYKPYDFKIMAMYQQNDSGEYTEINTMPASGYVINEEKSYCATNNTTQVKGKIKTINGNHIITNLNKGDKCYVWFDKKISVDNVSELLSKVESEAKTGTPTTFTSGATTDEGVYAVNDGMYGGTSYYWRGAVTNNYVKFANFCWRIVRINGDGSIRLIYDGTTCHANGLNSESIVNTSVAYNSGYNNSSYVGWTYTVGSQRPTNNATATASNAKTQTENWYNNNIIGTNNEKVTIGKFCNDRSVGEGSYSATGSSFRYGGYSRLYTIKVPTLSCPEGDVYELKTGVITVDEAMYAGGTNANNSSYYLYNGQNYWTMSPLSWYGGSGCASYVFRVHSDGGLSIDSNDWTGYSSGIRPVINLKSDTTFATGGNGTQNNPYVVS